MIKYVQDNLFSTPAQVLVNTVNLDGVMGKGIALQFKKIYPDMFKKYQYFCETKLFTMGKLWLYKTDSKWILNFPTKLHWREKSKLEYIELGLKKFVETYSKHNITSIAFPKLGCGNGGLNWKIVKPLMDQYLKNLPIDIYVYEGDFSQESEYANTEAIKKWLNSYPDDLSFNEYYHDIQVIANKNNHQITTSTEDIESFWYSFKSDKIKTRETVDDYLLDVYNLTKQLEYVSTIDLIVGLAGKVTEAIQLKKTTEGVAVCQLEMQV